MPNATGVTLITITATNSGSIATQAFTLTIVGVDDLPTLDPINDVVLDSPTQNNRTTDVPLTGITSGAANENQTLSITASSSALTIASVRTITYTNGSSGTLTLELVRSAVGSTLVTVNVSDGQATNNRTFRLNLKSTANTSPTISAITSPTIDQNTSTGLLPFTIGDSTTPAALLGLRATSLNPSLVPNSTSNITFGGSGSNRAITVTPVLNRSGVAPIVVTVTDTNFGLVNTNFTVTVRPINTQPTISTITNRSMLEDGGTLSVPFVVTDLETPAASLVLSNASSNPALIGPADIVLAGTGSNRVALITPARDQSGPATITITVRDLDGGAASSQFTVNVTSVNDPPTLDELVDVSLVRGGSQVIQLTGITSGASNENQTLTVTATSSQTNSFPNPVVSYTSANPTGSITLNANPAAGSTAVITVTVTDSGAPTGSVSRTFTASIQSPGNALPVISGVTNRTISEDTVLGPITLSVSDVETAASNLVVSGSSSNTGLVANTNITITGNGTNRSLFITPVTNASGTTTITLSVADLDFGFRSTNFTLTVTPVNDPPTISSLLDQSVAEDSQTPVLPLTLQDVDGPVGLITLQAASSNQTLVAISNVLFGGTGSNRTVQVRPTPNQSGSAFIVLRATDAAGATAETSFTLNVGPSNDLPTMSAIADQVMDEDSTLGPLLFTVDDAEPGPLTIAFNSSNPGLLPTQNISSGGPGQNQTITLTPVTNAFGDAVVTVTVSDTEGRSATNRFRVTVRPVNDAPTLDPISNRQLRAGAGRQTIALSGISSGPSNEVQTLSVSAVSSNPQLIPQPTVIYSSASATGSVVFTPVAGISGTATIRVTVNDGQAPNNLAAREFDVAVNAAPLIAQLPDVNTDEDVPAGPIPIPITDADSPSNTVSLTAISSNPLLLTSNNIALSGPTNASVMLTPSLNQHGFSIVTLIATDTNGNSTSNNFAFIVHPVNDLPLVSIIPDQDAATNQVVGPIAFTVTDVETPAQDLWVTAESSNSALIPPANILLTGSNSVRSIVIQPVGAPGTSTVSVAVTDANGGTTNRTFLLRISDSLVAPFITGQPADQTVPAGNSAIFLVTAGGSHPLTYQWQHDGTNIAGATNPILSIPGVQPADAGQYTVTINNSSGSVTSSPARLVVRVAVRITAITWSAPSVTISFESISGASYNVEYSENFTDWLLLQTVAATGSTTTVTDTSPSAPARFYRIRVD